MKRTALLLFGIALPALGQRFNITVDGKPVSRAQVCATRAGGPASPMTRFFTGTGVLCVSADGDVQLPAGTWNVFARRGTELISDAVVLVTSGESKTYNLALVPAAAVEHDSEPLYVYVPGTSSVIPVKDIVPAVRVVPLVAKGDRVTAIGTPDTPKAGKTIHFEFPEERGSVIAQVALHGDAAPPQVTIAGASQRADSSLLFFRGVPAGTPTINLTGERWKDEHMPVKVTAGAIAVGRLIVARLKANLRVHWSVQSDLPKSRDCDGKTVNAKPLELLLFDCSGGCAQADRSVPADRLKGIFSVGRREIPSDATKGVVEFEGIGAGSYQLRAGPVQKNITANDNADVSFDIRYVTFSGRVTRGGKPLHVRLFGTATDADTGDYAAALIALPKDGAPVELLPCEGGKVIKVVPDKPPADNAHFDIDVPDNHLIIHVTDAESRAPVAKAYVSMDALEDGHDEAAHFSGPAGMTDADGRLVIDSAVANKRLHICAWRNDYENACSDRFQLGSVTEKTVELALSKSSARRGRVVLDGTHSVASVAWYTPDGRMTEITQVQDDGTFVYQRVHAPGEIVAYFSANQPLIVMRQPQLGDGDVLEIRPPYGARVRRFEVSLSAAAHEAAFIALAIGDIVVPEDALRWHTSRRGDSIIVSPGRTTLVVDIVESGPIRVIMIPLSIANVQDRTPDIAMRPEVNALPQKALGEGMRVDFP